MNAMQSITHRNCVRNDNSPSLGRPGGAGVFALGMGKACDVIAVWVHRVDLVGAVAVRGEGNPIPVG